ncbi:receptor-like protein EIX1 [Coffea eugenioides]|uniref:receptor-like protein EIX1 n=1 Tax=Coffea eugenioides TaxID=49369 RepID=UPI000F6083E5|nr:receptor-like protein EIX1 [Coffea eugenioides]
MRHPNFLDTTSSLLSLFLFITILVTSQIPLGFTGQAHSSNFTCIESERQALLQFRDSLTDESNRLSSWIGENYCSWDGISCNKVTGHVVKLDLCNSEQPGFEIYSHWYHCRSCLAGHQLSPSLVNLTNLRHLDLSLNNFSGIRIPTFLGLLKELRYLNLSDAGFVGEVPHHLGNLSHLRYLDIGVVLGGIIQNKLTSNDLEWVARLSSLETLSLNSVDLSGAQDVFNAINMLPLLKALDLEGCRLTIPHLLHVNSTSLSSLDLSANQFINPTIAPWLGNLTGLQDLNLRFCYLGGEVHDTFEQMGSLVKLNLYGNCFDTSTLKSICNISSLTSLQMTENNLQGSIPNEIALDICRNNLEGSLKSFATGILNLDLSRSAFAGNSS